MPTVDLTAEWVPVHAEPGVDVAVPVTVPAGYETGAWSASLYPNGVSGAVASFGVAVVGQVVTFSLTAAQTGTLVPSGAHRFDGFWVISRTLAGVVDWWIKGPFLISRGRLLGGDQALDLTAQWTPIFGEPGTDLVIPITVPAGLQTGTWTATVYADDWSTTVLASFTVGVAGQVVTATMTGTATTALMGGGQWFTGFWVLQRAAPGGAVDWWLKGPFQVGFGQQQASDGAQALAVTVTNTAVNVTVNVPQAVAVSVATPVIEVLSTSVSGVTPSDLAAAIAASTAGETYHHVQAAPATTWTVPHGLGRHPVVDVTTTAGDRMWTGIHHVDNNTLTVSLLTAQSGYAECS